MAHRPHFEKQCIMELLKEKERDRDQKTSREPAGEGGRGASKTRCGQVDHTDVSENRRAVREGSQGHTKMYAALT